MLFIYLKDTYNYWWYHSFIKGICECFEINNIKYEISVNIIDISNKVKENDVLFCVSGVMNPQDRILRLSFNNMKNKKTKIIVYNTEDIKNSEKFKNKMYNFLNNKPDCVMDFSNERLNMLINTPYKLKVCPGYYSSLEIKLEKKSKIYDVLCYGSMNERRLNLEKKLQKVGLNVLFKLYSCEKSQQEDIEQSKIILDSYFYGITGIDFFRCNFLAANKIFFIHETPIKEDKDEDFLNTVVHASYEDLPQRCVEWLSKSEQERDAKALEVHNLFKTKYNLQDQLPYEFFK